MTSSAWVVSSSSRSCCRPVSVSKRAIAKRRPCFDPWISRSAALVAEAYIDLLEAIDASVAASARSMIANPSRSSASVIDSGGFVKK